MNNMMPQLSNKSGGWSQRVPMLLSTKKDASGRNNFQPWVDSLKDSLGLQFGAMTQVFETNVPFEVDAIDPEDWADIDGMPPLTDGMRRDLIVSARKNFMKDVRDLKNKQPQFYAERSRLTRSLPRPATMTTAVQKVLTQ